MTLTFRYSAINSAHFCLKKYQLQYLQGKKEPGPESGHFVFGTCMHQAIQAYFEGSDPITAFRLFWNSVDPDKYEWDRYSYSVLSDTGEKLLTKWVRLHAKNYQALHLEYDMQFNLQGFTMTGKPDFIGYYQGKLSIVDWKTSHARYDKRKALVDGQMWIYSKGVKDTLNLQVEQLVYAPFIKYDASVQTPVVVPFSFEKQQNMLTNAVHMMQDLSKREVFPRNEQNCLRCKFFPVCYPEGETDE